MLQSCLTAEEWSMNRTRTGPARSMGSARLTSSRSISMLSGWSQGSTLTGWRTHLYRSQGPDGGFHTGYDQLGTYAGTQENAETTSIAITTISNLSTTRPFPFSFPFFDIPPWIIYLYTGLAAAAVAVVVRVIVSDQRKRKPQRSLV